MPPLTSTPDTAPLLFFQERRSFSEIKQELLVKYFDTWCGYRLKTRSAASEEPLLYIDLNTAGQEQDILTAGFKVLHNLIRSTISKQNLNKVLRFYFGDPLKPKQAELHQEITQLSAYEELAHKPAFLLEPENKALLEETLQGGCPALLVMDPFSYGYAQEMLLDSCMNRRADLLMLLSPDSIRKALASKKVSKSLSELFGDRLSIISAFCRKEKDNGRRQEYILQHFERLLREKGFFTLLFQINEPETGVANQFIMFSSPDASAYHSYKETIMPYSDYQGDGIPLFVANQVPEHQLSLFQQAPKFTMENLISELADGAPHYKFKSIEKICELHSINTHYIPDNYLAAFDQLRDQGKIILLNGKTMQPIRKATFTSVVKYVQTIQTTIG